MGASQSGWSQTRDENLHGVARHPAVRRSKRRKALPKDEYTSYLPELVREVVLHFAVMSSTRALSSLCLVSSFIREITLPVLLNTVLIDSLPQVALFIKLLFSETRGPPPASLVHYLWVSAKANMEDCAEIYKHCTNLKKLAVHHTTFLCLIHSTIDWPNGTGPLLTTGTIFSRKDLHLIILSSPMYQHEQQFVDLAPIAAQLYNKITHLHLTLEPLELEMHLYLFGCLTHFALPYPMKGTPQIQQSIGHPTLKIVVITHTRTPHSKELIHLESWLRELRKRDRRFYFLKYAPPVLDSDLQVRKCWVEDEDSIWETAVMETEKWERLG